MGSTVNNRSLTNWLQLLFSAGLLILFFLPWVAWNDSLISGYHMPSGKFFHVAENKFNLANPFPEINFTFYAFWLIPVFAAVTTILAWQKKNTLWPAFIASIVTLSLVTVFYLFTKTLIDLGVGNNALQMLKIPAYLSAVFAAGLILTALPAGKWPLRIVFLLAGPVFVFLGFMIIEKKVWGETHEDTSTAKADYTINAPELIREFLMNDTLANRKYKEKIIIVNGRVSQAEQLADSTLNIQFADSTTGSYIIFSFEKSQFEKVKNIKINDSISAKGSCSGSIYSEILGNTSISFKRSTLNNK